MENLEKIENKKISEGLEDFEDFKLKINELIMSERQKKEKNEHYNATLECVDFNNLTNEDFEIYKSFLDKKLSREDLNNYKGKLRGYLANQVIYLENMKWFNPEKYQMYIETVKEKIKEEK
ncbi:hypothetical protein JW698_00045 [Candidatus Wolfebacteria bacterium]|nr:hypothetical protein [Candidatus Wolfebacteria bacterium]